MRPAQCHEPCFECSLPTRPAERPGRSSTITHQLRNLGERGLEEAYVIEQLRKLFERAFNLLDVFVAILNFPIRCSGLTILGRGREL